MGIGMVAVVRPADAADVAEAVRGAGVDVWTLGRIEVGHGVRYLG